MTFKVELNSLVHDDRDRVIEDTLSKDNGIQLRIHLVLIENSENRHWIRGRQGRSKDQAFE
jgi:hypothetical protein